MTGFESKQTSRGDKDVPDADQLAVDFGPLFRAAALNQAEEADDQEAQPGSAQDEASQVLSPPATRTPPPARQLLLQFPSELCESEQVAGSGRARPPPQ